MKTLMETSIVRGGLRRPNWICRSVKQNVVLVRDASSSMSGAPADQASAASIDLVAELAQPMNKDGFNVAIVDFAKRAYTAHGLTKATELAPTTTPLRIGGEQVGDGTNIADGIDAAGTILGKSGETDQAGFTYLRPVVIVLTDGCHNVGPSPQDASTKLKTLADLVTVAFGDTADEALLRDLASTPQHFYRCSNGRDLRQFLAAVGATMTATMAEGTNATQALTTIGRSD